MMMVRVAPDALPAPLVAALAGANVHVALHAPKTDRYIVRWGLASGQRQEIESDGACGRCLTPDERRAELPPPRREHLPDEGVAFVTSYRLKDQSFEALVNFATEDGSVDIDQLVNVADPP